MKTAAVIGTVILAGVVLLPAARKRGTSTRRKTRASKKNGLLGSISFRPSVDRPVGFRGDWTGRFPGANPPVAWRSQTKCLTYTLRCQAGKPGSKDKGKPVTEQFPYRYRTVTEWLIVGPFKPADTEKGLDEEFIPNEATFKPKPGDKADNRTWTSWTPKPWIKYGWYRTTPPSAKKSIIPTFSDALRPKEDLHAKFKGREWALGLTKLPESEVGFGELFSDCQTDPCGVITNKVVAYALTYLYAPRDGAIGIVFKQWCHMKIYVNDKPVFNSKYKGNSIGRSLDKVELKKGWNRLLVKLNNTGKFLRLDLKLWPNFKDSSYEMQNIKWKIPMTASSPGTPIVVGDRMFVSTDFNEMFCLNKKDGKVLWMKMSHPYYTMTEAERKAHPGMAAEVKPMMAKIDTLNKDIVKEINDFAAANPPESIAQPKNLRRLTQARNKLWFSALKLMQAADKERYKNSREAPFGSTGSAGASGFTPCSDGKYVYDFYFYSCVASCYDLDGNRKWASAIDPVFRHSTHHGYNAAPALGAGKLVVFNAALTAFDATTGAKVWQGPHDNRIIFQSPMITKIGTTDVVLSPPLDAIMRLSDGKALWTGDSFQDYVPSVVVVDGIGYCNGSYKNKGPLSVKLPSSEAGAGKGPQRLIKMEKCVAGVASPLYHDGLLYNIRHDSGELHVNDTKTGQSVYIEPLDLKPYMHLHGGIYCSPVLGGKYVYITDNEGATIVVKAGRKHEVVGRNILDSLAPPRYAPARINETTGDAGGGPIFDGKRIYFRGRSNLYCIEEQGAKSGSRK